MVRRFIVPVVAAATLVPAAGWAQSTPTSATTPDIGQKIHDVLTAQGFTDVTVVPNSFVASGTDKDGKPVVMLIRPRSLTAMTPADPADPGDASDGTRSKEPVWQ